MIAQKLSIWKEDATNRSLESISVVAAILYPKTSEKRKLANTGYLAPIADTFTALLTLFGAGIYSVSRKDD